MANNFSPNKYKYIELESVGTREGVDDSSWRSNLYFLLKGAINAGSQGTENFSIINSALSKDDLIVDNKIHLLMESKAPEIKASIKTEKGFSSLVSQVEESVPGVKTFTSALSNGLNLYSKVVSLVEGLDGNNTSTSNTFNPWALSAPTWKEDDPNFIEDISYTFKFRMGQYRLWNAKKEVVIPILNLIAPILPQKLGSTYTSGPFPSIMNLLGKALSSSLSSLKEYMDDNTSSNAFSNIWSSSNGTFSKITSTLSAGVDILGNLLTAIVLSGYKNYSYKVTFGDFCTFKHVIYKTASWKFSQETDQDGFPVAGNVTLIFEPLVPVALTSTSSVSKSLTYKTASTN